MLLIMVPVIPAPYRRPKGRTLSGALKRSSLRSLLQELRKLLILLLLVGRSVFFLDIRKRLGPEAEGLQHRILMLGG